MTEYFYAQKILLLLKMLVRLIDIAKPGYHTHFIHSQIFFIHTLFRPHEMHFKHLIHFLIFATCQHDLPLSIIDRIPIVLWLDDVKRYRLWQFLRLHKNILFPFQRDRFIQEEHGRICFKVFYLSGNNICHLTRKRNFKCILQKIFPLLLIIFENTFCNILCFA